MTRHVQQHSFELSRSLQPVESHDLAERDLEAIEERPAADGGRTFALRLLISSQSNIIELHSQRLSLSLSRFSCHAQQVKARHKATKPLPISCAHVVINMRRKNKIERAHFYAAR